MKAPLAIIVASLCLLVLAPSSAAAVGLADQRLAGSPPRGSETASGLIAPLNVCPGQARLDAAAGAQEDAMRCMTNYAREHTGLQSLAGAEQLDGSAHGKAGDVLSCDEFSHFACGRAFTFWMDQSGYLSTPCWRAGENLAWGTGEEGTVHSIFRAWMRSPGHRRNILGEFEQLGIGLRVGNLDGLTGTHVWVQHFGSHCE